MKIFYIIDYFFGPSGGTEKQLLMLIRGMREHQHEVRLFVLHHTDYTRSVIDFPCPIESLNVQSITSIWSLARMLRFRHRVRQEKPGVIHTFFNDSAMLVPLFCRIKGTLVFTSRRDLGYWYTWDQLLLLRLANLRVDRIICNCHAVVRAVSKREQVAPEKLTVIYNGLNINSTTCTEWATNRDLLMTRELAGPIRVCLMANPRPVKRLEDFISAAATITGQLEGCIFLIVGSPPPTDYQRGLEDLIDRLRLHEKVCFVGSISDPKAFLNHCHIGVLTSASEGLSNAILEYMEVGLPVICSDVGGNSELVRNGENGFLYPVGDVKTLSQHILRLCQNDELRRTMGDASLQRVKSFSNERMVEEHLRAYRCYPIELPNIQTNS